VQAIDILGDQRKSGEHFLKRSQRVVAWIGRHFADKFAAPVVPFPDDFGIGHERIHAGQVFGSEFGPQPFISSECRDSGFGGNPRPGQGGYDRTSSHDFGYSIKHDRQDTVRRAD
jgi:hypothetical protein